MRRRRLIIRTSRSISKRRNRRISGIRHVLIIRSKRIRMSLIISIHRCTHTSANIKIGTSTSRMIKQALKYYTK